MKYLKLYENFDLTENVWVIMDEAEELIYGDILKLTDEHSYRGSGRMITPWSHIMIPTENANKDTFKEFSYSSQKEAMDSIEYISKDGEKAGGIYIGYDYTPKFSGNWRMMNGKVIGKKPNPYKRFFSGDDLKLKPVKFFMGIMKANELNI